MEAKERARTAYARGQSAFAQSDFPVAQAAFEEAYANVPNPIVLLSIAECAAKQQRTQDALKAYDTYLQKRPDAPDREEVAQKRASLALSPADVTLLSEPQGADIVIDGQLTGRRTPAILQLSPGAHQISAVLSGYENEPVAVQVSAGAKMEQTLALHAPAPPPTAAVTPPPASETKPLEKPEPPTAALVVTGSLGVAGLVAGTVLGILALSERSDYDKNPTEAGADRGERLALFADVGFGVGAMALVTTAVLLLTHDDVKAPEQTARVGIEVIPSVTARGASATAKVRF
jgi:tetratricopeptide (TPR) repeat protein